MLKRTRCGAARVVITPPLFALHPPTLFQILGKRGAERPCGTSRRPCGTDAEPSRHRWGALEQSFHPHRAQYINAVPPPHDCRRLVVRGTYEQG